MNLHIYQFSAQNRPNSDLLMKRVADLWCEATGHAPFMKDISRPQFSRPRFVFAPDVHFSITHSGEYWLCAIADAPVGIDLQIHQKADYHGIARRHFHPLEAAWLETHPDDFFKIWTAKEAWVKYTGKGIDNDFDAFSSVGPDGLLSYIDGIPLRRLDFRPGYTLSIIYNPGNELSIPAIEPLFL